MDGPAVSLADKGMTATTGSIDAVWWCRGVEGRKESAWASPSGQLANPTGVNMDLGRTGLRDSDLLRAGLQITIVMRASVGTNTILNAVGFQGTRHS